MLVGRIDMNKILATCVLITAVGGLSACKTAGDYDTGVSSDQWPSISGNYATRGQEIGEKVILPTEAPMPVVATVAAKPVPVVAPIAKPIAIVAPVAVKAPVKTAKVKSAKTAKTAPNKARSFGSVLVAGNDEINFPIPSRMISKAVKAAATNRETFAFGGYDVVAGRASLFDPRGAKRDFVVFYKQAMQEHVIGPRLDTEVLPFIRQATGCNISHGAGERKIETLPMDRTVVFPISCGKN